MGRKEIWVFAELVNGQPAPVFYELAGKADEIARDKAWITAAVILGSDVEQAATYVHEVCDKVYIAENEWLENYTLESYALALEKIARENEPEMILMGATGIGSELAPTVAAKLKTGLAAHCVDIVVDKERDRINCMVPAFGGKVISEIYIPDARPMMASVRPGIIERTAVSRNCSESVKVDVAFLNSLDPKEVFLEKTVEETSGIKLEEANVVVAAGMGVKTDQAWEDLQQIASKLSGAVAWSRNFVDSGKVDSESNMIGTSGKSVKPAVFIGAGISGAMHFVCGMQKSKLVISINKDEKAKMFNYSDYGVVGDAGKFFEALNKKF